MSRLLSSNDGAARDSGANPLANPAKTPAQVPAESAYRLSAGTNGLNSRPMTHEKTGRVTTNMPNADRSARSMRNGRAADSQINFVLVTGRRLSLTPIQIWRLMTDRKRDADPLLPLLI